MARAVDQLCFGALARVDVLEHHGQMLGAAGAVADEHQHEPEPAERAVLAVQRLLELAAVVVAVRHSRHRCGQLVAPDRLAGECAVHISECTLGGVVRLADVPVEVERHQSHRRRVEHRAVLPLARRECVLGVLALADVDHHALPVQKTGRLVAADRRMLAHPDDVPVLVDHSVLGVQLGQIRARLCVRSCTPVAIVGVEDLEPQLVLVQPRCELVAKKILDLRADVERQRLVRVVGLYEVQVDDQARDGLEHGLEAIRSDPLAWVRAHLTPISAPPIGGLTCKQGSRKSGLYWAALADVAQLARASACHAEGRGFESHHPLDLEERPADAGLSLSQPPALPPLLAIT